MQWMKAYMAETFCNQLSLIDSVMPIKISSLIIPFPIIQCWQPIMEHTKKATQSVSIKPSLLRWEKMTHWPSGNIEDRKCCESTQYVQQV